MPKTKTSDRDIPLTDALIDDLKKYIDWFRLADEEFDSRLDETYLAVNVYRQPLYPQSIGKWLTFYERKWDIYSPSGFAHRPEFCCRRSGILSCLPYTTYGWYVR